ncbi:hypothetical protein DMENIID0001_145620 [Sergentomyia squamirostris]
MMASSEENADTQMILTDLNHDCLLHIFSFLNLKEMTKMRLVCTKLNEVADDAYRFCRRLDCVELSENSKMTEKQLEKIASKVGAFVTTLKIEFFFFPFEDYELYGLKESELKEMEEAFRSHFCSILQSCPKVKHLVIVGNDDAFEEEPLQKMLPKLLTLRLEGMYLNDQLAALFYEFPHFESLTLDFCNYESELIFTRLCNLKELHLSGPNGLVNRVDKDSFEIFCKANQSLRKLTLDEVDFCNIDFINLVTTFLKNIEHLDFCRSRKCTDLESYSPNCLLDLPKLTHLTIVVNKTDVDLLKRLAAQQRLLYLDLSIHFFDDQEKASEILNAILEFPLITMMTSSEGNADSQMILTDLNHDCLLQIFSFLNLKEMTKMRLVCTKLNEVADDAYRFCRHLDCVELRQNSKMTDAQLEKIASKVGYFVTILKIEYFYSTFEDYDRFRLKESELAEIEEALSSHFCSILQSCPKVKHLVIVGNDDAFEEEPLQRMLPNLLTLRLEGMYLNDQLAALFYEFPHFESLTLDFCNYESELIFTRLCNLKELHLIISNGCPSFVDKKDSFEIFCKANQALRKFTLNEVKFCNLDIINLVTTYLKNIEHLDFSRFLKYTNLQSYSINCLLDLPKLTHLTIPVDENDSDFLKRLAAQQRLLYLDLSFNFSENKETISEILNVVLEFRGKRGSFHCELTHCLIGWFTSDGCRPILLTYKDALFAHTFSCTQQLSSRAVKTFARRSHLSLLPRVFIDID